MPRRGHPSRLASRAALAVALSAAQFAAQPDPAIAQGGRSIGSVAAANADIVGTPPEAETRRLLPGTGLIQDERIETSSLGAGQFLFLDQTALSVWPNSRIVLDRYVYDPDRRAGEIAVTVTQGVLRFIGGRISKTSDVEIRTPNAVVSVRGGMAQIEVTPEGTRAMHIAGEYTRIGGVTLSRSSATAVVRTGETQAVFEGVGDGAAVSRMYGGKLGEGDGGAAQGVTASDVEQIVAQSGVAALGSGDLAATSAAPVSTLGRRAPETRESGEIIASKGSAQAVLANSAAPATPERAAEAPSPPNPSPPVPSPPTPSPPVPSPPVPSPPTPSPPTPSPPASAPPLEPKPNPAPSPKPAPEPTPEPAPTPPQQPGAQPTPEPQPESRPEPQPEPQPTPGPQPEPAPQPQPDPEPQADPEPQPGPSPTPPRTLSFSGAFFWTGDAGFTDAAGRAVAAPARNGLVARPGGGVRFTNFIGAPEGGEPSGVTAETPGGGGVEIPQIAGLVRGEQVRDARAGAFVRFADPGVFSLDGFRATDSGEPLLTLAFFGAPTPRADWAGTSGDGVQTRRYALSSDLLRDRVAPGPADVADIPGAAPTLIFVGERGAPAIRDPAEGLGASSPTASVWMLGQFVLEGEGAAQRSALAVMTAPAGPNAAGLPDVAGRALLFTRLDAADAPGFGAIPFAALDPGDGSTTFGEGGAHFVLGQGSPETTIEAATFEQWSNAAPLDAVFGDVRLATLAETRVVAADARIALAAPIAATDLAATAAPGLDAALTGGFAAAHGTSFRGFEPAGAQVGRPYLVATGAPTDVVLGFDPARNAVAAEFGGLHATRGDARIDDARLVFGGAGASAMRDDRTFAASTPAGAAGLLTGGALSADGVEPPARPDAQGRQQAFSGALASSGLVGDGGLLDASRSAPEHLRWGWWAGELDVGADDPTAPVAAERERLHAGSWVAGVLSDLADVRAATHSARYDGLALGHVVEPGAGAAYVEGGSYRLQYDFGARVGKAHISGILDQTFISVVTEAGGTVGAHYGGAFTNVANGGSGRLDGAFFTAGDDPTAATAGRFSLTATTPAGAAAEVTGIFGADRR